MAIRNDTHVTLYDPHPGFAGAMIPLPVAVKRVADELDGQTLTLGEAVARIQAVTSGHVEYVTYLTHQWIKLTLKSGGAFHTFRVIRFRFAE